MASGQVTSCGGLFNIFSGTTSCSSFLLTPLPSPGGLVWWPPLNISVVITTAVAGDLQFSTGREELNGLKVGNSLVRYPAAVRFLIDSLQPFVIFGWTAENVIIDAYACFYTENAFRLVDVAGSGAAVFR